MFSGLRTEVIGLRKEDYDTTSGLNGFSSNIKLLFYLKKKKKRLLRDRFLKEWSESKLQWSRFPYF